MTYYDLFNVKNQYQSDLFITFQIIYVIIIIFLKLLLKPINGFDTSTNWRENTIFARQ